LEFSVVQNNSISSFSRSKREAIFRLNFLLSLQLNKIHLYRSSGISPWLGNRHPSGDFYITFRFILVVPVSEQAIRFLNEGLLSTLRFTFIAQQDFIFSSIFNRLTIIYLHS